MMIENLFQEDLLLTMENGTLSDYSDYFTALFRTQENFLEPFADQTYYGKYSPVHGVGGEKVHGFPRTGESWVEFQNWIDTAYTLATPIKTVVAALCAGSITVADITAWFAASGGYKRPTTGSVCAGEAVVTTMTASNGTVLGTGLVTDLQWETAYNTVLIPYERSINSSVSKSLRYIKNLVQFGEQATYYRTSTFLFDGTGL